MPRQTGLCLAVTLLAATAACGRDEARPAHENPTLLHQRIWIEKVREKPTEMIHAFGAFQEREPVGFFAQASLYKATGELFNFEVTRDRLKLRFPQDGREAEIRFHLERCKSDIPEADLCLFLDNNPWNGPKRYYGVRFDRGREYLPGALWGAL